MAKFGGVNWRAERSELNTKTGSLPRCHDSRTTPAGRGRIGAASALAPSSSVAARAARSVAFCDKRRLHRLLEA